MNVQTMQEIQQQFIEFTKTISEKIISENNEVTVVFNGSMQIVTLQFDNSLPLEKISPIIIDTINLGIKNTSMKVNEGIKKMNLQIQSINK